MSKSTLVHWRQAFDVCMQMAGVGPLAKHVARLPEKDRAKLLEGIGSELLREKVNTLLRQRQEQLALV